MSTSTSTRSSGVCAPQGFVASGVAAGLKASGGSDVAMVVNEGPQQACAAVFTSNRIVAAPVVWSRQVVQAGSARAVVLNSGGANACTGAQGLIDTEQTAQEAASLLGVGPSDILVCSTGLIGEPLPMQKLLPGVVEAAARLTPDGGADAAAAIMTTDTVSKQSVAVRDGYTIGGMAKGAGMLAPGLATMLVVLTTDAVLTSAELDGALREATRVTFDRTDSDGCMSTNDTVVLLASGAAATTPGLADFTVGLTEVCADLASQLIRDAEGAAHNIAITTTNAASELDAEEVGRAVARSNLFKTAIFGNDPNWGRVLSAVGTTNAVFDPAAINVSINGVQICRNGGIGEPRSDVDLQPRDVKVEIDLQAGQESATIWTNDLTHDYVQENSAYSS